MRTEPIGAVGRAARSILRPPKGGAGGLLIAWTAVLLITLFAGLGFHPQNRVHWLPAANGIRFEGRGFAHASQPWRELLATPNAPSCSIELLLVPRETSTDHVANILSDDDRGQGPDILLAQWRSILVMRTRFTFPDQPPRRGELGLDDVFRSGVPVHIVVTSAPGVTKFYINGVPKLSHVASLDVEQFAGGLLLGNSGAMDDPWTGDVLLLALHNAALTPAEVQEQYRNAGRAAPGPATRALYLFSERSGTQARSQVATAAPLDIPRYVRVLTRRFLVWDLRLGSPGRLDVAINIVGFVPFAFFTAALLRHHLRWHAILVGASTIVLAALLSFGIEYLQAYLPGRDSSVTDLLNNSLGAVLGVLLWAVCLWFWPATERA